MGIATTVRMRANGLRLCPTNSWGVIVTYENPEGLEHVAEP